jgi:thymidylate kinase
VEKAERIMDKFIVVEGPDGSGKSTLVNKLDSYLSEKSKCAVTYTREPSCGAIGHLLRDVLWGNFTFPPSAMERLFIADREDHCLKMIGPWLEKGHVICDRYYYSTMAYQALESLGAFESKWTLDECGKFGTSMQEELKDRFEGILSSHLYKTTHGYDTVVLRPDMAIVLVADPSVLIDRIGKRGSEKEIYDSNHRVRIVSATYKLICEWIEGELLKINTMYPGECSTLIPGRQVVIDVSCKTEEEVFQEAVLHIDNLLGK